MVRLKADATTVVRLKADTTYSGPPEGGRHVLPDELIAGAVDGEDVLGLVRGTLDLLPQLRDEVVDRPRGRRFLISPDLIEDLLARDHLAGVRHEIPEEVELARREIDPLTGAVRLMGPEVDVDVADAARLEARRPS